VSGRLLTLREARERTGLSRERVAAWAGISSKTLERWEKGVTPPKQYVVDRLAALYRVNPEDLLR